ncbi:unnamed protein product [Penicillium olsonii]|uniref:C4-dicarboxylate transporter/malic acid transport protein n=1 Tax=Penicillium olsonii TaxID=99116 RepID=A0A9W4MQG3_PENOL|nr:unnamed protein product [Penicillium olsonii]CAG8081211.1 unnamed protein product [Penicillium olsonii]
MSLYTKVSLKERLCLITWSWYSMCVATGGIAVLLSRTPHQFHGITIIGKIVYILNLVLFTGISCCMTLRFCNRPAEIKESFQRPTETYFFPTFLLAIATIILGAEAYGTDACGPWLQVALRIVFWIYVACSLSVGIFHNWYLYSTVMGRKQHFPLPRVLPSFPTMLCGTVASSIAGNQPREHALPIIIGGLTLQGFGIMMSILIYAEYHYYLNKHGLPEPSQRPKMFIAAGPWSFTALAFIGMAKHAIEKFPPRYIISDAVPGSTGTVSISTGEIALVIASLTSIFMWCMAFFHMCVAILSMFSMLRCFGGPGAAPMSMSYWSMVFPNTGFVIATISIGEVLESEGIKWVGSILTILQISVWLGVGLATVYGVSTRRMLWPADAKRSA